jgi:hypothetical protein
MYPYKKKKYAYNFFLTEEEKQLIFTLKNLHRLNNRLGSSKEEYASFIHDMTSYYKNILIDYSIDNKIYAENNKTNQESHCPDQSGGTNYDYSQEQV